MAALLVSVGVMLVLMTVAMPVWRHEAQREKEAELVFRGEQYARAVNLYQRKMGPGNFPPNIDLLVQQRFLRKKYKDPITNGDFQIIPVGGAVPQVPGQQPDQGGRGRGGRGLQPASPGFGQTQRGMNGDRQGAASQFGQGAPGAGGIMGVVSKSKDTSILVYHGGTHYNEWTFLFSNVSNRPGGPGGRGAPGLPGQRGRGGRATPGGPEQGFPAPGLGGGGGLGGGSGRGRFGGPRGRGAGPG